jgi:hypothetical protein
MSNRNVIDLDDPLLPGDLLVPDKLEVVDIVLEQIEDDMVNSITDCGSCSCGCGCGCGCIC